MRRRLSKSRFSEGGTHEETLRPQDQGKAGKLMNGRRGQGLGGVDERSIETGVKGVD